ncbi:MAG: lysophospholipid acyltransferase family protein [Chthoniobacterales bacterium]
MAPPSSQPDTTSLIEAEPHHRRTFNRILYSVFIFKLTCWLYPYLGRRIFRWVSVTVSFIYAITQHKIRRIVQQNMQLLTAKKITCKDAVDLFVTFGATISDYVCSGNMPRQEAFNLCEECLGVEYITEAVKDGLGAILVTGHFGFFELGSLHLSEMGYRVAVVTLPEPRENLTQWRTEFRSRWGAETIEIGDDFFSAIKVVHSLQEGKLTAMLVDRPFGPRAIPVALPNGKSLFSTSPAIVAFASDRPVIPVIVKKLPSQNYTIEALGCIYPKRLPEGRDASIEAMTKEIAALLMKEIAKHPKQWFQFVPVEI